MANDSGDFARSMSIATSGLRAQAGRMRVISENIANADSTAPTAGGDPYRRKVPTFSSELDRALDARVVTLGKIRPDQTAFNVKHEPSNPAPLFIRRAQRLIKKSFLEIVRDLMPDSLSQLEKLAGDVEKT